MYEHGETQSQEALPLAAGVVLPGNRVAAQGTTGGVAAIFSRAPRQRASVEGRDFVVLDLVTAQGCDVTAGARMEYAVWPNSSAGCVLSVRVASSAVCTVVRPRWTSLTSRRCGW